MVFKSVLAAIKFIFESDDWQIHSSEILANPVNVEEFGHHMIFLLYPQLNIASL